jgi:mono/diheme cytochrome c family protein
MKGRKMNAFKIRLILAVLFPVACAAAAGARMEALRSGSYAPDSLGLITQAAAPALALNSSYQVASYPAFALQLADGPGRAETQIQCGSCHTPRYITMQPPLPAATWDAVVRKMIKTYGAPVSEADAQKIIQYLQANYAPETRR